MKDGTAKKQKEAASIETASLANLMFIKNLLIELFF